MNHLRLGRHHHRIHALTLLLLVASVMGVINSGTATQKSFAAANDQTGVINFCRLSGTQTIIYGWGYDVNNTSDSSQPIVQITVGGTTKNTDTSIGGYHDTEISAYISQNVDKNKYKPTPSGFTVAFDNLQQGSSYSISGSIKGTSKAVMAIDTTSKNVDGITGGNLFTASNTLPDSCLNAKPAVAAPTAKATATPTSSPTATTTSKSSTSGTSSGSSNGGSTKISMTVATTAANSGGTSTKDTAAAGTGLSVAAGTLSVTINLPVDGATNAYVQYGPSLDNLQEATDTQVVSGDTAKIIVPNLLAKTKYYYQVVRTMADGSVVPDAVGDFTTAGYAINLQFVDAKSKPIKGIDGQLSDTAKTVDTSDDKGNLTFFDLGPGTYTVTFERDGKLYKQSFDTSKIEDAAATNGETATLRNTVNVAKLSGGTAGSLGKSNPLLKVVLIIGILLVIIGSIWLTIRRLKKRAEVRDTYEDTNYESRDPGIIDVPTAQAALYAAPLPVAPLVAPTPIAPGAPISNTLFDGPFVPPTQTPMQVPSQPTIAPAEQTAHAGQSLREMVLESMREQAAQRHDDGPTNPPTQPPVA